MIDAHCHLHFQSFTGLKDLDQILPEIESFVLSDYGGDSRRNMLTLVKRDPFFCTMGTHPWNTVEEVSEWREELDENFIKENKVVAIGETGLDFMKERGEEERKKQTQKFLDHILVAQYHHLPLVLHVVRAHQEVLKILKETHYLEGGIVHAFNGSPELAQQYLDAGFLLSIGPQILNPGKSIVKTITYAGIGKLVLESDATGESRPGQIESHPRILNNVAKTVAELIGFDIERVRDETRDNTMRVFRFPKVKDD